MAIALAIAIKLTPILPAGIFLAALLVAAHLEGWSRSATRRAVGAATGTVLGLVLFLLIVPAMFVGPAANWSHLGTWFDRIVIHHDMGEENNSGFYSMRNQSLDNAVARLGNWAAYGVADGPPDVPEEGAHGAASRPPRELPLVHRALTGVKCALTFLLLAVAWRSARRNDSLELAALFGLACVLTLIVSPLSWAHHYLLWLPGLLLVPCWLCARGKRASPRGSLSRPAR